MNSEENWQRVHPASPFVRGWLAIIGLIFIYWRNTEDWSMAERFSGPRLFWTLVSAGAALVVILIFYFFSWYFTRYRLTDTHVYVNSGMLIRSQKQARLDKVQAIDIAQPLGARILGLAELRFDVADGSESVLRLAFLRKAEAQELREQLLRQMGSPQAAVQPEAVVVEEPQPLTAKVPAGRLLASIILQLPILVGLMATISLLISYLLGAQGVLTALIPMVLGFGGWAYKEINQGWNFSASAQDAGVRISYGLADTRQHSIPAGRVQAIMITAPLFWRMLGWYRVQVNVMGTKSDEDDNLSVLPVGSFEEVSRLMGILLPDLGIENQREVLRTAVSTGSAHGFIGSPERAKPLSPGAWKHQGFLVTGTTLISRYGWLTRQATFVPHRQVQGMSWQQGPWERRRKLAGVRLYCAGGNIMGYLHQIDQQTAAEFMQVQSKRLLER